MSNQGHIKRKKFSHLSNEEAGKRRMIAKKQECDRVLKISEALDELQKLLPKTDGVNKKSKLEILKTVKDYIVQIPKCAKHRNNAGVQSAKLKQQQHMGFKLKPEVSSTASNFQVDPSTFACGSGQTRWLQHNNSGQLGWSYPNQTILSMHAGLSGSAQILPTSASSTNISFVDNSNWQALSKCNQTRPSTQTVLSGSDQTLPTLTSANSNLHDWSKCNQTGPSEQIGFSNLRHSVPTSTSSTDIPFDVLEFLLDIPSNMLPDQTPNVSSPAQSQRDLLAFLTDLPPTVLPDQMPDVSSTIIGSSCAYVP